MWPRRDIIEFAESECRFDSTGPRPGELWRLSDAPFLADVLRDFADPAVRMGVCMTGAQGGKTQTGIICASWAMAEAPGPFMWALPARDEAKTFAETRLLESFRRCCALAEVMPSGRYKQSQLEIQFPVAPLLLVGAGSGSKVSGKPIRWLFLDEEKDYEPGVAEKAMKRVRAKFPSKIWRMSTPKLWGESIHAGFLQGTQNHWHVRCPVCGELHQMEFKNLVWDEGPGWAASIRYRCPCCAKRDAQGGIISDGHVWRDIPADREYLHGPGGKWVAHNPAPDPGTVSYQWPAVLPNWVRWLDLVKEFRAAMEAKRRGDLSKLMVFVTETCGEPWRDEETEREAVSLALGDYTLASVDGLTPVPGEVVRLMTIDRQKDHFWATIRAWRPDGSSRQLFAGRVSTREGCREMQLRFGVRDSMTWEDTGYLPHEVWRDCADFGWLGISGEREGLKLYLHEERRGGRTVQVRRPFSNLQTVANVDGRPVRMMSINSHICKDMLDTLRRGPSWELPSDCNPDYLAHHEGEMKKEKIGRNGKTEMKWVKVGPNHLWDCDTYQVGVAIALGILAAPQISVDDAVPAGTVES